MGNIVLLDDLTINKIAAGEVIERPASVVKEMVENSIDAGSKNISIEIKNGGISFIKITDDGCGIAEDDMEIAFERHATSKIRNASDLSTVTTMGFRGEALASIASIANVVMTSKKEGENIGHKIVVEAGKILEKNEVGCPVGTTIIVRNLFFNTPVRYKFLKKDYTEAGYIEEAVRRIALSNPNVSIKLISSGKTIIQTNGSGNLKDIIYSIYGKEIANAIIDVNYQYSDIKVTGVIGNQNVARSNRQNQTFFINGRFVKDKTLSTAVSQAYKDIITNGKFAFVVLNLEMNPEKLDVNVHPAKLEVRFQDENEIFKAIYHAIKASFGNESKIEDIENDKIEVEEKTNILKNDSEAKKIEDDFNSKIKEGMSIEERVNLINSVINRITPIETEFKKSKKTENIEVKPNNANESILQESTGNLIEDIYKGGFLTKKREIFSDKNNVEIKDEDKKVINFGNTKISSGTQEVPILNKNEKSDVSKEINSDNTKSVSTQDTVVNNNFDINNLDKIELEENKKHFSNEENINDLDNSKNEEFISKLESNLLQERIDSRENTQFIDTNIVREEIRNNKEQRINQKLEEITPQFEEMYKKAFGVDISSSKKGTEKEIDKIEDKVDIAEVEYAAGINETLFDQNEEYKKVDYKYIGIAFSKYIIVEMKNELYMIDITSAYKKIIYNRIRENFIQNGEIESQFLLLPDIIQLTDKQMVLSKENIEIFKQMGFVIEEFGDNTIKVVSVPSISENLNTKQLFLEILDQIYNIAVIEIEEKEEKIMSVISAMIADEEKNKFSEQDIDELLQELLKMENPFLDSNGKSLATKISKYDLDRKFSRC